MKVLFLLATAISSVSAAISVSGVSVSGSGCPNTTPLTFSVSGNDVFVTISSTTFVARHGPGVPVSDNRKNCQISVNVSGQAGKKYAPQSGLWKGSVELASGVTGRKSVTAFAQSNAGVSCTSQNSWTGPLPLTSYSFTESLDSLCYTSCGSQDFSFINEGLSLVGTGSSVSTLSGVEGGDVEFKITFVETNC